MSAKGIRSARVSTASTALSDISTPESKVPRIFEGDNESTIIPSESLAFEGPRSGSTTYGPFGTPHVAKVCPKSSL